MYTNKQSTSTNLSMESPGPVYDLPGALGAQTLSKSMTAPAFKFGMRPLSDANMAKENRPGPGSYGMPDSIGPQASSLKNNTERYRFGKSNRWSDYSTDFKKDFSTPASASTPRPTTGWLGDAPAFSLGRGQRYIFGEGFAGLKPTSRRGLLPHPAAASQSMMNAARSARHVPGAGSYTAPSSIGLQLLADKATSPQFKLGSASREKTAKVYLTHAHERELIGTHSPAPNVYAARSSIGAQFVSKNANASAWKFGTADRFSEVKERGGKLPALLNTVPGPGSYGV